MAASFRIRTAQPLDRSCWEPLWHAYQTSRKIPDEVTEVTWQRFFDEHEPVHALVAEERGELIGFAHYLFHRSTAQIHPICYLQDMFTEESARRRGIGRALIEGVCAHAKTARASRVYWHTGTRNTVARALYDRIGTLTSFVQYRKYL
jgi:GNAT superfamily N-acetyltransferase